MGLRMPELIIIGLILVVLFGGSKLPQLGAGIGQGIRNFKKAMAGDEESKKDPTPPEQSPKA
jgi:sec-independent protein translocase protein TatA